MDSCQPFPGHTFWIYTLVAEHIGPVLLVTHPMVDGINCETLQLVQISKFLHYENNESCDLRQIVFMPPLRSLATHMYMVMAECRRPTTPEKLFVVRFAKDSTIWGINQ